VDGVEGFDGFDVGVHLAFVVGRTAGIEIAVALGGFEGRGFPEVEGVGRLDVEMAITEDGRLAGGVQPVGVDQGMALGFDDFDVFEAGVAEFGGYVLGGAVGIVIVLGESGDAGDAEEFLQFFEEARLVLGYVTI
jgi:hypothetical protein